MSDRKTILTQFIHLRTRKAELKDELKFLQEELDEKEVELVSCMENESLQSFKDTEHGTIYLRADVFARITNEKAFFVWLRNNKLMDVVKQTVHHSTLKAIVKDHNMDVMGVDTHVVSKIGVRGVK